MATSKKRRGPSGKPPSGRPATPAAKAEPAAKPKETRPADKPRQSKRERAEARAAAARRRRRRKVILLIAGGVLVIALLAVLVFAGEAEGSTDPAAWDVPSTGPTEDVQERVTLAELRGHRLAWPLARDIGSPNGSGLSRALGARGMPLTAFYDAEGLLVHVQLGSILEPQLRAALNQFYGLEV